MLKWLSIMAAAFAAVFLAGVWWLSRDVREGLDTGKMSMASGRDGMPAYFEGFVGRWNREVAHWLSSEVERLKREGGDPGELDLLKKRTLSGDFLQILPSSSLPGGLVWQDGMDQPDIGDPRAMKGGEIDIWGGVMFPSTFRPFGPESTSFFGYSMYGQVDMKLVAIHPQTEEIIPGLADRWAVSGDGRKIYFHLAPEAAYSDGSPIKAMDFILYLCLRTSPAVKDSLYSNEVKKQLAGIRVYGDDILEMELPRAVPWAPFKAAGLLAPAHPGFYADFNAGYVDRYQWRIPPGTGGYILDANRIVRGRALTLKRVKNWWAADRKYYRYSCNVDAITHHFFRSDTKAYEMFRLGQLDYLTVYKPELWEALLQIPPVLDGYVEMVSFTRRFPEPPYGIYLNTGAPPLDNIDVRTGLLYAMPMQEILDSLFRGYFSRLCSLTDGYGSMTADLAWPDYSPTKARAYFARAGYSRVGPDGILVNGRGDRLSIELAYAELSPLIGNVCRKLKEGARACGVDLRLDPLDGSVCARKVNEKRHMAVFWATMFDYPVPNLFPMLHSSQGRDAAGRLVSNTENVFSIADAELDSALAEAAEASGRDDLRRALKRIQTRVRDLAIWVPGWKDDSARMAYWRWIQWPDSETTRFCYPIIFNPLESHLYWIDPTIRQEVNEARREGRKFPESVKRISPIEPEG